MQITVNNQPHPLDGAAVTLTQLLTQIDIPDAGTAVAINQTVVPRSAWNNTQLQDGDQVMVIRATAGG